MNPQPEIPTGEQPRCSVVILNWNGADLAIECYRSIAAQTFSDREIIILDNASNDDSVPHLRKTCPGARIVEHHRNEGTGGGFAAGARHSQGEFILFLCNDTVLEPDALEKLVDTMDKNPDCGACGVKQLDYRDPTIVQHLGYAVDKFGFQHCFDDNTTDDGKDETREAWVSGTVFMTRREAYEKAGGYDPVHFTLNDEVDLCWRLRIHGYRMLIRTGARVIHHHFATLGAEARTRTRYWAERHLLRTLLKNYSTWSLLRILPQYWLLQTAEFFFLCLQGRFGMAWSDIRAGFWNLRMLPDTWRHHRRVQKTRTVTDRELRKDFWPGCIKLHWGLQLLRTRKRIASDR
jgi:GT2 family glycosyltransferase